jgi:hypothetical protein
MNISEIKIFVGLLYSCVILVFEPICQMIKDRVRGKMVILLPGPTRQTSQTVQI